MKFKLFISYSHKDNASNKSHIDNFKKHIFPLKEKGIIEDWYDREIFVGEEYKEKIDNNLENANIICLFISANFLSSLNCRKEKEKAFKLKKEKGVIIVPIILSPCGWQDDSELSKLLVTPEDGKPVSNFKNKNDAWNSVYEELKRIINKEIEIKKLKIKDEFKIYLNDTDMLATAHSNKEKLLLDDIFVYPDLDKYDDFKDYEKRISSKELIKNILDYDKILISGEDQSSKTTLCKKIFCELREKNYIPVLISDKENKLLGDMKKIIERYYNKQYENGLIENFDKKKIIPIVDDFHYTKYKEKQIKKLSEYQRCVIIVDDIFCLNFEDEYLVKSYKYFKIKPLKASLRNDLIKKWLIATDKTDDLYKNDNKLYKNLDHNTEHIDTSLGKIIGRGIMPAYPFYILLMISAKEAYTKPLDQEITSQGHCYQALIYLYLRKQNVNNEDVDTYINFLTEFAHYIFKKKKDELSEEDFLKFIDYYSKKFNWPINKNTLIRKLLKINLITLDNLNNYSFTYKYLYYYFVGKYLADYIDEEKATIKNLLNNLHVNENAYIAVFISHHSKNINILKELLENASSLFDEFPVSSLSKKELEFFDKNVDEIVDAVLPSSNKSSESERKKRLKLKDELEQEKEDEKNNDIEDIELRRAIKTVEVMGRIIKNRAGSLEKNKLEDIFKEAMNVHLRILSCIFDSIKDKEAQEYIIELISNKLEEIQTEEESEFDYDKQKKISKRIYWNINYLLIYGFIDKTIHSLGSDKLISIIRKVDKDINCPATGLVLHGTLMWYNKSLQINEIVKMIKRKDFSKIAERTMKHMIGIHCSLHRINYREKQKIHEKLKIPIKKLPYKED